MAYCHIQYEGYLQIQKLCTVIMLLSPSTVLIFHLTSKLLHGTLQDIFGSIHIRQAIMTFFSSSVLGFNYGPAKESNTSQTEHNVEAQSMGSSDSHIFCRICHETRPKEAVYSLCKCKGTMGMIHVSCLEHWLEESNRNSCELCGEAYPMARVLRYTVPKGLFMWFCTNDTRGSIFHNVRRVRFDMFICLCITPAVILGTYFCLIAADFYSLDNNLKFAPVRWMTTLSLLIMVAVLVFGYYMWMYSSVQYHFRVWFYWWQRNVTVKLVMKPSEEVGATASTSDPYGREQCDSQSQTQAITIQNYTDNSTHQVTNQERPIVHFNLGHDKSTAPKQTLVDVETVLSNAELPKPSAYSTNPVIASCAVVMTRSTSETEICEAEPDSLQECISSPSPSSTSTSS